MAPQETAPRLEARGWLGIDIGGTFTDLVLVDGAGAVHTHKLLTTPEDPARAVLAGTEALLARANDAPTRIVHGTTLITNAVVEREGATTALLTTRGFRDVLAIRREGRYDLYDLGLRFSEPLVPRALRIEADERMDESGAALQTLDEAGLERALVPLAGAGIESWAVCFLHAYANPEHELAAERVLRSTFPGIPVSVSHQVAPEIREYERTSTTVANAYVRPVAARYLDRLGEGLARVVSAAAGEPRRPRLQILLSDGGLTTPEIAARFPIRIVESGPAGGVIAAQRLGEARNAPAIMSLDMGGTTAKIAFIENGEARTRSTFEMDRRHLYRRGSGLPVQVPSIDLVEIGAGGGSLADRGPLGTLVVGPKSAGADPGPAAYGRGGTGATVTDADIVLGILSPEAFLGGTMQLDAAAAETAIRTHVAGPLDIPLTDAARGIHELVGSNMAEAARIHAAERGLHLHAFTLVAFGGAGPVHAWGVARQLRMRHVLFPPYAGVQSALGFLAAAPAYEVSRTDVRSLDRFEPDAVRPLIDALRTEARKMVAGSGHGEPGVRISADMRYHGQGAEVRVAVDPDTIDRDGLHRSFLETYRTLYGRAVPGLPVEIVTWRVRCEYPAPVLDAIDAVGRVDGKAAGGVPAPPASTRTAWVPDLDAPTEVPVYALSDLAPGTRFEGPALIEDLASTLVVGRGRGEVLPGGAVHAELLP